MLAEKFRVQDSTSMVIATGRIIGNGGNAGCMAGTLHVTLLAAEVSRVPMYVLAHHIV